MPYVVIRMSEGATLDQKRELVKEVTEVVAQNLNIPLESVAIELEEYPLE